MYYYIDDKPIQDLINKRKCFNSRKELFLNAIKHNKCSKIKDFRNYINFIWKLIKYIFIPSVFFLIYYLYFLSLETCNEGIDRCCRKFRWIELKIKEEVFSCILMELMIQLIIHKYISKLHIIHIIIALGYFYYKSHGLNFHDHGYFNFFYYLIMLLIFTMVFIPFDCFVIYCNFKKFTFKLIAIYFLIILFLNVFFRTIGKNCDDWPKGLNNTYIQNNKSIYGCQIEFPKSCIYKKLEYFQDYTKFIRKDCKYQNGKKEKETILKYSKSPFINKTVNRIGYPLFNKDNVCFLDFPDYDNILTKYFFHNLVDIDNKDILIKYYKNKMPEVEVDFSNINEPKLNINLHFNKTLSDERKFLENKTEPFSDNIIILYVDSISRVNALRQLKKTTKFFEKFMPYKGKFHSKYPSHNFHSFQFFKYHSFNGHTSINYPFLFYGQNGTDKNKSHITKYLKENGFITSAANDWCVKDNTRTYHNYTTEDMYDHILPLCDPNNGHFNSNTMRCLYGKQNIEYLLEYTNQFWRKYKKNRKYSIIMVNHAHEGTLTVVKYIDDLMFNFINNLYNDNLLKDTIVFLLSDHGVGMPSIYFSAEFYKKEVNLPMLLIIINDRKNISYEEQYKYIYENQQTFITPFDIYNTLGNIIYGNQYYKIENKTKNKNSCKSVYGKSIFDKINPKERKPSKYLYLGKLGFSKSICK